jgi:hypothetical protein
MHPIANNIAIHVLFHPNNASRFLPASDRVAKDTRTCQATWHVIDSTVKGNFTFMILARRSTIRAARHSVINDGRCATRYFICMIVGSSR